MSAASQPLMQAAHAVESLERRISALEATSEQLACLIDGLARSALDVTPPPAPPARSRQKTPPAQA